jgi:hypothetical protein
VLWSFVYVFSQRSIGVSTFVLGGLLQLLGHFEPYFLGVFWGAFLPFFGPFKKMIWPILNSNEINTSESRTVLDPSPT